MNLELLAESDISGQGIVFIIVIIFSFLKWLYQNLTNKSSGTEREDSEELESLYEQYREEIQQRQAVVTPPPLQPTERTPVTESSFSATPPTLPNAPTDLDPHTSVAYSQDDIERARLLKESVALASPHAHFGAKKKKTKQLPIGSLKQQLRHKKSLRNALVLQEILSPPKALQDS